MKEIDLSKNSISVSDKKNKIILFNSYTSNGDIIDYWSELTSNRGANYTILRDGRVVKHTPDSHVFPIVSYKVDLDAISICIDNLGYLTFDDDTATIVDYMGNTYDEEANVYIKKWKSYDMWEPYTDEQVQSASDLIKALCSANNIPRKCVSHNTKIDNCEVLSGVLYRSNFSKYYNDLSPAWPYDIFKNIIEGKNEIINGEGDNTDDGEEDTKRDGQTDHHAYRGKE